MKKKRKKVGIEREIVRDVEGWSGRWEVGGRIRRKGRGSFISI